MRVFRFAGFAVLMLSACSSVTLPPQPTPASIQNTATALAGITVDPVTAWWDGDYAVRAACHAYLNSAAQQAATLNIANVGLATVGAAGSLINPLVGVGTSLAQGFLSAFQSSGAMPYTAATSTIIENALDSYEAGVVQSPPTTIAQAASYVDDEWFQCSPGGYAELVEKSIASANVTAAPMSVSSPALMFAPNTAFRQAPVLFGRPKVYVNGH